MNMRYAWSVRHVRLVILAMVFAGAAAADDKYPASPVKVMVPYSAGGPADYVARPVAQALSEILNASFVIENRGGADGVIGAATVARAEPDGYTMIITTGSLVSSAVTKGNLPYDPIKDFKPVTQLAESYGFVLVTGPGFPANNLEELIARIKEKPGQITYATSGFGNATHIAAKLFERVVGVKMIDVPYKGGGAGLTDVMSGVVDLTFISASLAAPQIKEGKLKAFVSTGNERIPALPDLPTMKEKGFKDVVINGYYGIWLPAGVSNVIVDKLQKAAVKAVTVPSVQSLLEKAGLKSVGSSPEEFATHIDKDIKWHASVMTLIDLKKQ